MPLDAQNFDFTQAKSDGSDLRFSKTSSKGEPILPHAIEYWDKAGQTAALWVKLDVVKGNNRAQSFVMHWGNAEAADAGDAKVVFEAKEGFVGRLPPQRGGQRGRGRLQGRHRQRGPHDRRQPQARLRASTGRVGKGLLLTYGQVQWVKLDHPRKKRLFDLTTRGTFSIWARASSYQNKGNKEIRALPGYETMFAKGDNSWRLQKFGIRDWHKPPADLLEMCVEQPPSADLCVVGKTDMVRGSGSRWSRSTTSPRPRCT